MFLLAQAADNTVAEFILDAIDRFGVAVGILIFAGICVWKIGTWLGKDTGPVNRIIASHLDFVESAKQLGEKQVVLQEKSADMHAQHFTRSEKACAEVRNVREAGSAACDVLDQLGDHYSWPTHIKASVAEVRRLLDRNTGSVV